MDQPRPPFSHNFYPVNQNTNDPPTQENSFNWPPGFAFPPTPFQQFQQAQVTQAAYAAYLRHLSSDYQPPTQLPNSGTPPNSTYFQPWFPTSRGVQNPVNVDAPIETSTVPPKVTSRNNKNWNHSEDKTLCEAWVQRSENPIIDINQTGEIFWTHIFSDFCNKQPETKRTKKGVENRWDSIQTNVTKWKATMDRVNRNHQCGTNSVDEVAQKF